MALRIIKKIIWKLQQGFLKNNGKGKELHDSLKAYIKNMLGIDASINTNFKNNFPIDMSIPPTHSGNLRTGNEIKD